ncbi:MAG TPA: ABC transporter permease [Nocardioidaceae bacterium]|nr:ABC transporter permease [Nocardioidaceae bacterium]
MKVLVAGLWARRGLNAAILLVAVTAIAASVLGPMYGRTSAEHLLDTRIEQRAPYATGLAYSVPALDAQQLPEGSPQAYRPPAPDDLLAEAASPLESAGIDRFWEPGRAWLHDTGGQLQFGANRFGVPLYWREGMCELAEVRGECPSAAGEVLIQATMADTMGLATGDRISLDYLERWLAEDPEVGTVERERTVEREFTVVGTYRIDDAGSADWFDLARFTGAANLVPPPAKGEGALPAAPALLAAPESMTSQTFAAGLDRPVDRGAVNLDSMDQVQAAVDEFRSGVIDITSAELLDNVDVAGLFDEVRAERSLLSQVTIAALAPLIVLALLLLYALVSSAALIRRPYVALAKLRGHSTGQVLRFALSEPYLVIALAVPVAVALAWSAAQLIARTWLIPGIPVVVDPVSLGALAAVTLAALVASAAAAVGVIREPLSAALSSSVSARSSSRWSLVLRSAVVAIAVASVAQLLGSDDDSGQLLGLLAPLFIALATAIGGVYLLTSATRWWVRRTRDGGGTAPYLASRRLARRQDLTKLMIPLLLAVSVITFAASAAATADDWRVSRAKADVGAPRTFTTDAVPGRLLQVTREVDPEGRYVAAAVVDLTGDDLGRRLLVDTSRLAAVAAWDESWSDDDIETLQQQLVPEVPEPVTFTGSTVAVTVADVRLDSRLSGTPALWLQYVDQAGEQNDVKLGDLPDGESVELVAPVRGCDEECAVEQIYLTGSASSVTDVQGELTITSVSVDGAPVDWRLADDGAWRAARPFPVSLVDPPVTLESSAGGLRVNVFLGQLPPGENSAPVMLSGYARITPGGTSDVVPVVVTEGTETVEVGAPTSGIGLDYPAGTVVGTALSGGQVPMRVVATVDALPALGDEGAMSDLATSLVEFEPPAGLLLETRLWVAEGAPESVLDAVRSAGITLSDEQRMDTTLEELRSDAFSLGWRIFLIVGAATLLLAIFGVLASAVAQSRWRSYEVASLRVVGLKQGNLVRASVLEYVTMLGFAVLLGIVSAGIALVLVLPSIDLGSAGAFDPAAAYAIHWEILGAVAGALFVLAALIALVVSRRITRLGRPATLRWAEQG